MRWRSTSRVVLLAALAFLAVSFDAHARDPEPAPPRSQSIGSAMRPATGADAAVFRWPGDDRIDPGRATPRSGLLRIAILGSLGTAILLVTARGIPAESLRSRPIRQRLAATRWLRGPPAPLLALR